LIAVGTVIAKNYLPYARVLAASLREWHPELPVYAALVDEPEGLFDPSGEPFSMLRVEELGIPQLADFCFRYGRREAVSATKPYLIRTLLRRGYRQALFLDADMLVMGDLSPLLEEVGRHSITLTPHVLRTGLPAETELNLLQCGVYNGGVVGASDTAESEAFLEWWQERLREHCVYSLAGGMHLDQRWLDLAPSFVRELGVVRDPAYNVAYWNVGERPEAERWRLFHASGFDPERLDQVTRYWPEKRMSEVGAAAEVLREYAGRVMAAGYAETRGWGYAWNRFANGAPISVAAREAYRRLGKARAYFTDPFGEELREWLEQREEVKVEEELGQWRGAAEARLAKLKEANILLGEQQVELDRLRNELAGERERTRFEAARATMFEQAAAERLELLERWAAEKSSLG
jgi:hypothetical protein